MADVVRLSQGGSFGQVNPSFKAPHGVRDQSADLASWPLGRRGAGQGIGSSKDWRSQQSRYSAQGLRGYASRAHRLARYAPNPASELVAPTEIA
jgi:hypothetical protein